MYEFWDGQLNKAWRILKENLDADTRSLWYLTPMVFLIELILFRNT